ncbi:MAG: hypothetical protein JXB50_10345 [Spirochaetes bacterium]|nr:hypothetical protein [Spirochaetota bacterium]
MFIKKTNYFLLLIIISTFTIINLSISSAEELSLSASRIDKHVFASKLIDKDMTVLVYIPKGYNIKEKFPVLYFLHGKGKTPDLLYEAGFNKTADNLIESGKIKPLIIVFPQIDNSYGLNSSLKYEENLFASNNRGMYEDYICKEIVTFIDATYSTIAERSGRFIGGSSMGGFASLHVAFKHEDLYSKVGGHMPAIYSYYDSSNLESFLFPTSKDRNENDPFYIAKKGKLTNIQVYLDAGDNDKYRLYEGCKALYKILIKNNIKAENYVFKGDHTTEYIKSNVEKYLVFYNGK